VLWIIYNEYCDKIHRTEVYVTLYTPADDANSTSTLVLGVYKSLDDAYQEAINKLMKDLKKYQKNKTKIANGQKKLNNEKKLSEKLKILSSLVNTAYGNEYGAPYVAIEQSKLS